VRQPSEKTQLATLRRDLRQSDSELRIVRAALTEYLARATKAEQELAEWKRRFDELLKLRVDVEASRVQRP
jgi:ribosomal protein L10